jgi:hypothetical protein
MRETSRFALRAGAAAALFLLFALPAGAETADSPRAIATKPLKLIGDGTAPAAPPRPEALVIATPPLRLVGDGAARRETAPAAPLTIETRPLKLLGAKP